MERTFDKKGGVLAACNHVPPQAVSHVSSTGVRHLRGVGPPSFWHLLCFPRRMGWNVMRVFYGNKNDEKFSDVGGFFFCWC